MCREGGIFFQVPRSPVGVQEQSDPPQYLGQIPFSCNHQKV